jgi:pseudouridine-5'-phosphate glycosidase
LTANLAVLEANARLAARIAANLADGDELLDR